MKIENLERAIKARSELFDLQRSIDKMESLEVDNIGFSLNDPLKDFHITIHLKENMYHPMYKEIFEFTLMKFKEAYKELLNEIDSL